MRFPRAPQVEAANFARARGRHDFTQFPNFQRCPSPPPPGLILPPPPTTTTLLPLPMTTTTTTPTMTTHKSEAAKKVRTSSRYETAGLVKHCVFSSSCSPLPVARHCRHGSACRRRRRSAPRRPPPGQTTQPQSPLLQAQQAARRIKPGQFLLKRNVIPPKYIKRLWMR